MALICLWREVEGGVEKGLEKIQRHIASWSVWRVHASSVHVCMCLCSGVVSLLLTKLFLCHSPFKSLLTNSLFLSLSLALWLSLTLNVSTSCHKTKHDLECPHRYYPDVIGCQGRGWCFNAANTSQTQHNIYKHNTTHSSTQSTKTWRSSTPRRGLHHTRPWRDIGLEHGHRNVRVSWSWCHSAAPAQWHHHGTGAEEMWAELKPISRAPERLWAGHLAPLSNCLHVYYGLNKRNCVHHINYYFSQYTHYHSDENKIMSHDSWDKVRITGLSLKIWIL